MWREKSYDSRGITSRVVFNWKNIGAAVVFAGISGLAANQAMSAVEGMVEEAREVASDKVSTSAVELEDCNRMNRYNPDHNICDAVSERHTEAWKELRKIDDTPFFGR